MLLLMTSIFVTYVKYKRRASTARELPDQYMGFLPVTTLLLIACDTAFYVIMFVEEYI